METKITFGDKLYAILSPISDAVKESNTEWFGENTQPLQASRMFYNAGKTFKTHKHKPNPRIINRTQEAFIVIKGSIKIDILEKNYNSDHIKSSFEELQRGIARGCHDGGYSIVCQQGQFYNPPSNVATLGSLTAKAGDIILIYDGFHKLSILEDNTICYEVKAGQFVVPLSEEKEFLE
jgi:hypothetical protein